MDNKIKLLGEYTVNLLSSVVNDFVADPKPEGVTYQELYDFSVHHSVSVMVYYALKKQNISENDIMPFYEDYKKFTIREAKQQLMTEVLLAQTEKKGIKCMPLKGFVIKKLYPIESMRYSVDVDIFIEKGKEKGIHETMKENGFTFNGERFSQLIYSREPIFNYEMHMLIDEGNMAISDYLNNVWSRAVLCDGSSYTYRMTNEDLYIYIIRHFHKHYLESGAGIRFVLDIYMFLRSLKDKTDFSYIEKKLGEFKLLEFSRHMEKLSAIWFENEQSSERYEIISEFVFRNGTFGEEQNGSIARTAGMTSEKKIGFFKKLRNFAGWFFLDLNTMKKIYPILNKAPVLLPFCWVYKGIYTLIFKPKIFVKRLKGTVTETKKLQNIHELSGL